MLPILSSGDRYGLLCVLVPIRGLFPFLSGVALASFLVLSSAFPFSGREETNSGPTSP